MTLIEWLNVYGGLFTTLSTIISALAAAISVIFAWRAVTEAVHLRKAETEPEVAVYLDRLSVSDIVLVIKNIGGGSAYDLSFTVVEPLSYSGYFINKESSIFKEIRYLAPGQEVRTLFDILAMGDEGGPLLSIKVRYTTKSRRPWFSETFDLTSKLIVRQAVAVDNKLVQLSGIHTTLENMQSSLKELTSSINRIAQKLR